MPLFLVTQLLLSLVGCHSLMCQMCRLEWRQPQAGGIVLSGGGIGLSDELALAALKTSAYK